MADSYLQVPGFHPTIDNPAFYQQRVDNPRILPSLHRHLWGRVVSLGSLTLKAEKEVLQKQKLKEKSEGSSSSALQQQQLQGAKRVKFKQRDAPFKVTGEGCNLMLEWSKPSVISLARTLEHLKREYKLFSNTAQTASPQKERVGDTPLLGVDLEFKLDGLNVFFYGLTPGRYIHVHVDKTCTQ